MYILCIETSGTNCSVAISYEGKCIASKEINTGNFSHAEKLHVFIQSLLEEVAISSNNFKAIAVSAGPGSYTGLRIGVSSAKGLCYAWNLPLIAIPTLEILAHSIQTDNKLIIPMLDARRMEVYASIFDAKYNEISPVKAQILEPNSFIEYLSSNEVIFLGDGSDKFSKICPHPNAIFIKDKFPSAITMCNLAWMRYQNQSFEDIAYYEPFYLKNFVANSK
ncbi:tRNA (adenosine(37)-N6)-threonylcarbamoyltransferase complex dimerization subunit type 1 TsaB [Capnocytophaga catalasegens]|uniref:tRNA (Adenosine(37)-N6)-threonylcarbamoyltransferase complex dimerization subunit type 1 TsaB n=1 Tax=Capnocytophaga catalasegens TaxID=1004260 RepID=A0AAV5B0A9_9FLAO|nr:tRNA (adenosine(37)-N6)-threonylcarbamoyltransferase complex dimerization subunit type 1 TsaB [Capnocytophaga catalasegens]GIZ14354.1 tRNA (adenosine(37)-N6)-threonylcarbamoyltransferase complex dimerization subunit type 1 TsaB [Capnocytophaga catalasegens]GJM51351.1 tRNA (adenosine(37)-N6)-threonylcarbamoyltransferase complex dimerization subunit type 1 TsaB [Capnocytophaga catalasegens]GJM53232.1 tRNA (adenosine(37)-N6)-threonylcarbamoyltransferase complex dimerization subunit type 1 TsaB [